MGVDHAAPDPAHPGTRPRPRRRGGARRRRARQRPDDRRELCVLPPRPALHLGAAADRHRVHVAVSVLADRPGPDQRHQRRATTVHRASDPADRDLALAPADHPYRTRDYRCSCCGARAGRPEPRELLIACALALLLRCALDPGSAAYYHLPLLLTLVTLDAWEGRSIPVTGLSGTALAFIVLDRFPQYLAPEVTNVAYIVTSIGVACLLARELRTARPAAHARPRAADNCNVTPRTHRLLLLAVGLAFGAARCARRVLDARKRRLRPRRAGGRRQRGAVSERGRPRPPRVPPSPTSR